MYLQLTNVCNMSCEMCCYSSGPRNKEDAQFMSIETFRAALQWAPRVRAPNGLVPRLNIGGGEPTVHPLLFQMIEEAVEFSNIHKLGRPWIVTNGKIKNHALKLAAIAKSGVIQCGLSRDKWHEEICQDVVDAFTEDQTESGIRIGQAKRDGRFIQSIGTPIRSGRARNMAPLVPLRDRCNGDGRPWVLPDGSVQQCGCDDSKTVGSVLTSFFPMNREWTCWCGRKSPHKSQYRLNPETHPGLV